MSYTKHKDFIADMDLANALKTAINSVYGTNIAIKPRPTPTITKVIFNDPATIVIWSDGIKTVVKCGEDDIFDREKGLAMAISKRYFGNRGNYYNIFKNWVLEQPEDTEKKILTLDDPGMNTPQSVIEAIQKDIKAIQKDIKALQNDEDEDADDDDDRW